MANEDRRRMPLDRCARPVTEHRPVTRPHLPICSARMTRAGILASLLFLFSATTNRADDWPQWRGLRRDGVWREQGHLNREYRIRMPTWGIAAAPLIDGDLVIVQIGGSDNACLVAFDKKSGKERWRALADGANYSAPIVVQQAGKRVLICRTADRVVGLDPQSGALYWEFAYPSRQTPLGIATPVVEGERLFLCGFYDGSLMLRLLPGARERSEGAATGVPRTVRTMG